MVFFDKEIEVIKDLSSKNVNLYVKPHPSDNPNSYEKLLVNNNFLLLDKGDYLKVDLVISYISTLATEYENNGVQVLRYDDKLFESNYNKICI